MLHSPLEVETGNIVNWNQNNDSELNTLNDNDNNFALILLIMSCRIIDTCLNFRIEKKIKCDQFIEWDYIIIKEYFSKVLILAQLSNLLISQLCKCLCFEIKLKKQSKHFCTKISCYKQRSVQK